MQTCSTSSTQSVIEFNAYNNGSDKYALLDVVLDSSMNKYILHALEGSSVQPYITKMYPNDTSAWTKGYSGLLVTHESKRMVLSANETIIRMITEKSPSINVQLVQISTGTVCSLNSFRKIALLFYFYYHLP